MSAKCKGKNRRGEPCGKSPITGREYCLKHGGRTPIGPAHHAFKHGRRSKYMPARLAEKYQESLSDPQLMEFRQDAALLQSRLHELLETGESLPLWDLTRDAFRDLRKAMRDGDSIGVAGALAGLESLINRGMADALRWADIYRVTEQMGKTKEREHKRLVQSEMMHSTEQLLAMLGKIADAANRTITKPEDLRAFQAALNSFGSIAPGESIGNTGH